MSKIKARAFKPRTTTVVLFQGDDLDPIEDARAEAQRAAVASAPRRMGDDDSVSEAVTTYDRLVDEAVERAVHIDLQAVGRKTYRALVAEHPKREGNDDDASWGFNYETFGDSLVPACIVDGQFESDRDRDDFLDSLSDGDWSRLYSAALLLNQSEGPDPKARLSSRLAQTSGVTETLPSASA